MALELCIIEHKVPNMTSSLPRFRDNLECFVVLASLLPIVFEQLGIGQVVWHLQLVG